MPESPLPSTEPVRAWWKWINWLALDAVAVGVAWLQVFARMTGARVTTGESVCLGIAVWLVYMADRLLDSGMGEGVAERHRFAARNVRWLLPLMAVAAASSTWWALHEMRWVTLRAGLWVGAVAVVYFGLLLVSRTKALSQVLLVIVSGLIVMGLVQSEAMIPTGVQLWRAAVIGALATVLYTGLRHHFNPPPWILTKKGLGGYIFALGVAVIPLSHLQDWPGLLHGTPVMLFASACTLNSLGIRLWENEGSGNPEILMLRWLYPWLLAVVGGGALAQAWTGDEWTRPVLGGVAGCIAGFGLLHAGRRRWSALAGGLAADGLMVAAALLVKWVGMRGLPG